MIGLLALGFLGVGLAIFASAYFQQKAAEEKVKTEPLTKEVSGTQPAQTVSKGFDMAEYMRKKTEYEEGCKLLSERLEAKEITAQEYHVQKHLLYKKVYGV